MAHATDGSAFDDESMPVHEIVAVQAASRPDHIAIIFGDQWISYAELECRANRLARHLRNSGIGRDSVVMVHLERSIDTIVSLLGVLKSGAAYLPVEREVPAGRIATIVKETDCQTVITDRRDVARFLDLPVATVTPDAAGTPDAGTPGTGMTTGACAGHPVDPPRHRVRPSDLAYVIYTSGSTGAPKGVAVEHGSLSHLCRGVNRRYGIGPSDRVLQFAAVSFDTSLEQILVTLTSGATLVLPELTWAPSELPERLARHGVTVMDLTPAYWRNVLAQLGTRHGGQGSGQTGGPADLPVRLVIVGGEAVRSEDCRTALRLMPGVRLVNAYGLTEVTITSCTMELTAGVLPPRGSAPVGRPLPGTTVHVLDERLRPVGPGEQGEVYLGGHGVARGYLAEEPSGPARYVADPFAGRPGARMFRTGDLGRWTPAGDLEILGRTDRQLKIRGFRVEPAEIESVLAGHETIEDVAVTVHRRGGEPRLAAHYTVPADAAHRPTAAELRAFVAGYLPDYMVPTAFVELPAMPTKSNGKVDLAALPEPAWNTRRAAGGSTAGAVERGLARLWHQVLASAGDARARAAIGPDDDFFDLGGNSILAAELLARVRASFGIEITQVRALTRLLLEDATLGSFADAVRAARAGTLDGSGRGVDFDAEARVGVPIRRAATEARWHDPAHVLLTGATGFLGVYLLRELLARTGAVVHCLVRAADRELAMRRIQANAAHYLRDGLAEQVAAGRVVAVPGDLTRPLLGLPEQQFDELAATVDAIHHPGGLVNFIYPYSHMSPANVGGTREIIRMAGRYRGIPIHYVSTMAVIAGFGTAGVRNVTEWTPADHADHLSVGYVESKWVAEAMLQNAAKQGLPVAVYRAADISGDCVTGAWNTATEMCAMKKFVVDTGMWPTAELPLDYTPVDRYAAAVVFIAGRALPGGEVYHLTNPNKAYIDDLADRLAAHGHRVRPVTWDRWVDKMVEVAVERPDHPMTPFAPLFIDRCATGQMSVAQMYLETTFPAFTRTNVEKALRGSGIEIPPVDAGMLDRYLRYLTSVDFL